MGLRSRGAPTSVPVTLLPSCEAVVLNVRVPAGGLGLLEDIFAPMPAFAAALAPPSGPACAVEAALLFGDGEKSAPIAAAWPGVKTALWRAWLARLLRGVMAGEASELSLIEPPSDMRLCPGVLL